MNNRKLFETVGPWSSPLFTSQVNGRKCFGIFGLLCFNTEWIQVDCLGAPNGAITIEKDLAGPKAWLTLVEPLSCRTEGGGQFPKDLSRTLFQAREDGISGVK